METNAPVNCNHTNHPAKKNWGDGPGIVLISHNCIDAKSHPSIKESTGVTFIHSSKVHVTNNRSNSFTGTILQAIS